MNGLVAQYLRSYLATRARRITAIVIAANFAFFAALLAVMLYQRSAAPYWPMPFHFPSLLMSSGLLLFALCASVTVAVAATQVEDSDREVPVRWIAIAISCWFVFLFLEIVEWVRLIWLEHLGPETAYGGTYFMLTGSHFIAATACLGWFAWVAVDVRNRDILAAALYSHFLVFW
ncbi:MAG TPA: hypothetical protein VNH18_04420, partial [Bryobacteraceae bacterium]|nr:hypothetical protein [Bryobacteraceae bacterium]